MRPPTRRLHSLLIILALALGPTAPRVLAEGGYTVYQSEASFDDVMDALKLAIELRGLYINNVMHLGEMLERTGKDLGLDAPLFGRAESVEFCSAVLSRQMISEVPARIVNCPFIISVYTLPGKDGTTFVAHREIPEAEVAASPVMARVAAMLEAVASAAATW